MITIPLAILKINFILAAASSTCTKNSFFFLPPWYEYMTLDPNTCTPQVKSFSDLYAIGLAVLEMLLRVAGFAAVISIIISGILYITSNGNSEKASKALSRLYNSLIGLAIAFLAAGFVAFIGNKLK